MAMLVITRGYMMIILWDSSELRIGGVRFVMAQIVRNKIILRLKPWFWGSPIGRNSKKGCLTARIQK